MPGMLICTTATTVLNTCRIVTCQIEKQDRYHFQGLDSSLVDCITGPRGELKANLNSFQAGLQVVAEPHRLH